MRVVKTENECISLSKRLLYISNEAGMQSGAAQRGAGKQARLLMAALHTAISLVQVDHVPVTVGDDLDLNAENHHPSSVCRDCFRDKNSVSLYNKIYIL